MRRSARAAGLIVAAFTLATPVARAATPCVMEQVGELSTTIYEGMPTFDAQVNGHPVHMLVDTGSEGTLLFHSGAAQLGLALRQVPGVQVYGAGGSDNAMSARVTSFRVGNLAGSDYDVLVVGRSDMGTIQGVLGARFLLQFDVEFDVPEGKIRFFRPKNCAGDQVVYWGTAYSETRMRLSPSDAIYVDVVINGVPIEAQMDSGAGVSVLTPEAAAKVGVTPRSEGVTADGKTFGIGAEKVDTYVGTFPTFAFGEETIRNAKLRIADLFRAGHEVPMNSHIPAAVVDEPRMLLGADFFKSHRIYIARGQNRVYVSYMGGPVFQTRRATEPEPAPER